MLGKLIRNRWVIQKKIGQGAFGEIFVARDLELQENVAIKMEKCDQKRETIKLEALVLKKLQGSPYAPKYISCGRYEDFNFLVMELLGQNISQLKRSLPDSKMSLQCVLKLGIEMISSIEDIHSIGFVHRDIKPSNFVLRRKKSENKSVCCILDFGLARKYVDADFSVKPPRSNVGFRGTARYASINSHEARDLGRCDDLWSLFYMLVELLVDDLPWKKLKDKEEIKTLKIIHNEPKFCQDLPEGFLKFFEHVRSLGFEDEPNYSYLRQILRDIYISNKFDETIPTELDMSFEQLTLNSPKTLTLDSNPAHLAMTNSFGKSFSPKLTREFSRLSEIKLNQNDNQDPQSGKLRNSLSLNHMAGEIFLKPNSINQPNKFNNFDRIQTFSPDNEIELDPIKPKFDDETETDEISEKKCKCCVIC
ncbi:tau tubulin kinase 2b [Anaeramoeba ignava]|uniref:non-specific serine/threonine protein kinase n=1 Tax=Anaeramoeba ignava TaxID=1746090 RepID=A0A9Q0RH38_ANAIG|nr:tau tubulin kinase 2b [Anaeramoeba ignava]